MAKTASPKKKAEKDATNAILNCALILDMSGSMGSIRNATIEACNTYLQGLKNDESAAKTRLSVIAFDNQFELWHDDIAAADIPIIGDEYTPRGSTALNDAIARTIALLDKKGKEEEKFLITVVTDGFENASVEYPINRETGNSPELAALVKSYEERGNWTFIYLGANDVNVERTAVFMGMSAGNAGSFTAERESVQNVGKVMYQTSVSRGASANYTSETAFADAGLGQDFRTTDKPKDADEKDEKKS